MLKQSILVINPGSTSTKIGVFNDKELLFEKVIIHPDEELNHFDKVIKQNDYRYNLIINHLYQQNFHFDNLKAIVARGGLMKPITSGVYEISEQMVNDLSMATYGQHASNLGAIIAYKLAQKYSVPAYIVDPVVVDELWPLARVSGLKGVQRRSLFHALNQKSVARKVSQEINKDYDKSNFVVAHLGGGISVSAHFQGQVVDTNNALNGDGPFSPERSGTLPLAEFAKWCYENQYNYQSVREIIANKGGIFSYFGTRDLKMLEEKAQNDEQVMLILEAMCYQVGKEIGAYATVLSGKLDGIILTGGLAQSEFLINLIKKYVSWIAKVFVVPGENELFALNDAVLNVLNKKTCVKVY